MVVNKFVMVISILMDIKYFTLMSKSKKCGKTINKNLIPRFEWERSRMIIKIQ